MYRIKKHIDLSTLQQYNFISHDDYYIRFGKTRDIFINKNTREIIDYKLDHSTYTGYAYTNEYKHNPKRYIKDLIENQLVEQVKENK